LADFDCTAHVDANRDGKCDNCKIDFTCAAHVDANSDGKCDECKATYYCDGHIDSDGNGKCDSCKAAFTCPAHVDGNGDEKCDICNAPYICPGHADANGDSKCDTCGAKYTPPKDYRPEFIAAMSATKPAAVTLTVRNNFGADGVLESVYVVTYAQDGSFTIVGEAKSLNEELTGDDIIVTPVNVSYDAETDTYSDGGEFVGKTPAAAGLTLNLANLKAGSYNTTETTLSAIVLKADTASVLGAAYDSDVTLLVTMGEGKIVSLSIAYGNAEIVCFYA
jgi:hypothetical protein